MPKGGWLDGAMGVMYGLEVARAFVEAHGGAGPGETGVDVISFIDEEGHFHGTTGSLAFCGEFDLETQGDIANPEGVTLSQALERAGFAGAPDGAARCLTATRHSSRPISSRGRVSNRRSRRIGIVTGIVGMRRTRVTFTGQADHAGTTPMALRRDAASAMIGFLHDLGGRFKALSADNTVWNFGYFQVEPGAPKRRGGVRRSRRSSIATSTPRCLTACQKPLEEATRDAADATGGKVTAATASGLAIDPAEMSPDIGRAIEDVSRALDTEPLWMPSGAGHDAMILARHMPSAMLFIPSIGGRSHDVAEDTSEEDIVLGANVLAGTVDRLLG